MRLSALFNFGKSPVEPSVAFRSLDSQTAKAFPGLPAAAPAPKATEADGSLRKAMEAEIELFKINWFLPTQAKWAYDNSPLKIWEKSRQVGATKTDAFHSVMIISPAEAKFDVWVSSRDDIQ